MLDGFTLSIEGSISGASRSRSLRLELTNTESGVTQTAQALLREPEAGRTRFSVAVPLDDQGLALTPGRWRAAIAGAGPAQPITVTTHLSDDGPTLINPRAPGTGMRYAATTTVAGRLVVAVKIPAPHAEVERLWPRAGHLRIEGRVLSNPPAEQGETAELVLNNRDDASRRSAEVLLQAGGRFDLEIPPDLLLTHGSDNERWSVSLTHRDEALPTGRMLDDVQRPRDVYEFPPVVISPAAPNATRVRAYFSETQRLLITCKPLRAEEAVA